MDDNHGDSSAEASAEEDTKDTEGCSLPLEAEQGKYLREVSRRQESGVRIRESRYPRFIRRSSACGGQASVEGDPIGEPWISSDRVDAGEKGGCLLYSFFAVHLRKMDATFSHAFLILFAVGPVHAPRHANDGVCFCD